MSEPTRPNPLDATHGDDAPTQAPPPSAPGDDPLAVTRTLAPAPDEAATATPGDGGEATAATGLPVRPPSVTLPEQTGRYRILGEIGRGGMGAVLLGRDEEMDRQLAIKVLLDGLAEGSEGVRRFLEEARVAGRLQHPGIVPVYDVGRFGDGRPYFTMKLVQGRTLADLLRQRPDPAADLPRFLKVFEQVSETLAYAHARGVIHRDLKPHNVMVGEFGEVQVMDWGLAKVLASGGRKPPDTTTHQGAYAPRSPDETAAGAVMGTPAYMAPEQARGETDRLDERCDVFGLGAILCEILTGRPPYTGSFTKVALAGALGEVADAFARLDACGADAQLISLAKACLRDDPAGRPRDAGAVAAAMTAHLAGVQQRLRGAELEKAAAQARAEEARAKASAERRARRLTLTLAGAVLLVAALVGGGLAGLEARRAETAASVNEALLKATRLREQARAADGDLVKWTEAVAAMKSARALAVSGHADAELRGRAEEGLAAVLAEEKQARHRLEQAAKNRRLLARFEDIHLRMSDRTDRGAAVYTKAARAYATVFRENDLDPDRLPVEEAARRIRALPEPVAQAVAGALDYWVFAEWCEYWTKRVRRPAGGPPVSRFDIVFTPDRVLNRNLKIWRKRLAVAQAADPDRLRRRLRDAITRLDLAGFKKIVNAEDAAALPAPSVRIMAEILYWTGGLDRAVGLLRRAQLRGHAGDFWVNHLLASYSGQTNPPAWDDVVRYATAAVALRPDCVQALHVLGDGLDRGGSTDKALEVYRQILRVKPDDGYAHTRIGAILWGRGDHAGAVPEFRQAARLEPDNAIARINLGGALRGTGHLEGAPAEYRQAARLRPDDDEAQRGVGETLLLQGKPSEGAAALARASRLGPKVAENHWVEGAALRRLGKLAEAEAALRCALKLNPGLNAARFELAATLASLGRSAEAVAEYRELLRRQPGDAEARRRLSDLLRQPSAQSEPAPAPGAIPQAGP